MIGTVRREALDHLLLMNQAHARQVLADFGTTTRIDLTRPEINDPLTPPGQPATVHNIDDQRLLRTRILGAAINEYRYAA